MSETNQAVLLAFFAGQYTVKFNDCSNGYYITSNTPFIDESKYYLRKNGDLYINTYWRYKSEGYWDTEQEAQDFLESWLSGAQV